MTKLTATRAPPRPTRIRRMLAVAPEVAPNLVSHRHLPQRVSHERRHVDELLVIRAAIDPHQHGEPRRIVQHRHRMVPHVGAVGDPLSRPRQERLRPRHVRPTPGRVRRHQHQKSRRRQRNEALRRKPVPLHLPDLERQRDRLALAERQARPGPRPQRRQRGIHRIPPRLARQRQHLPEPREPRRIQLAYLDRHSNSPRSMLTQAGA